MTTNVINMASRTKLIREAEKAREKREAERGADGLTDRQRAHLRQAQTADQDQIVLVSEWTWDEAKKCHVPGKKTHYPAGIDDIEIPQK